MLCGSIFLHKRRLRRRFGEYSRRQLTNYRPQKKTGIYLKEAEEVIALTIHCVLDCGVNRLGAV